MAALTDALGVMDVMGFFTVVFPFILVFAILYGILSRLELFGEKSSTINAIISLAVAIFFVSITQAVKFLNTLIPLFTAVLIVMTLVLMIFLFIGVKPEAITGAMKTPAGYLIMLAVVMIIIFYAMSSIDPNSYYNTHPEDIPEGVEIPGLNAPGTAEDYARIEFMRTLYSPTMLGLIVLVIVFAGATYLITREPA